MSSHAPEQSDGAGLVPLFDPASIPDPFPRLAQLRERGAVVPVSTPPGLGVSTAWLVTRLEEVIQVMKDKRFLMDPSSLSEQGPELAKGLQFFGGRSLLNVDGEDHRRLRSLVSRVFTPRYIETLRPAIQQITDDLLDKVQGQGRMDVVQDFGNPLPIIVISDMLGVPTAQRDRIQSWSEALTGLSMGALTDQISNLGRLADFVRQLLAEKREHPQEDLLSKLATLEAGGDSLSDSELIGLVTLLIFAGHETTAKMISIGVLNLLTHPDQLERVKADPSLVRQAVEEILRYNTPAQIPTPRFASEDVELGGQLIRRGDMVLVSVASAGHDELVYDNSEDFNIARTITEQIAFGAGVHACLGAPLARLEGDIALSTLLRRMPNLRLDVPHDSIKWKGSVFLRGLRSLPVAF